MLRTTKNMKEKYEKIQNYLFTLIPEKWEEIYLYASVVSSPENMQSGEMFFYYLPKGILKRRPINVYEVPRRFNINEEQYLKIVEELYKCIKSLKQDFIDTDQDLWSNITISIANYKFRVEYFYDTLPANEKEVFTRNVIWKYNYLKIGGESREERKILEEHFINSKAPKRELYETGLYMKTENNTIGFDKEDNYHREFILYEKDNISTLKKETKSSKIIQEPSKEEDKKDKKKLRNQILDN